ncbi:helix-turn-helix transcriptional regulator [Schaalia sp. Marseille-Q2122]|uniref:helix-turn-helix domain-containing protein n=1 Tax=Schaalia sp. Marseille-Q2122 TaxID=2736604 RepID=UPI001C377181|nr:helix-turn-helix transcriptional regulator [Schaalia sp. Marseille-Q2122]
MIRVNIDRLLGERGMSVSDFADAIGITPANVAVLKNGRARAIRFTTLEAICRVLNCQPADVLEYLPEEDASASYPIDEADAAG